MKVTKHSLYVTRSKINGYPEIDNEKMDNGHHRKNKDRYINKARTANNRQKKKGNI